MTYFQESKCSVFEKHKSNKTISTHIWHKCMLQYFKINRNFIFSFVIKKIFTPKVGFQWIFLTGRIKNCYSFIMKNIFKCISRKYLNAFSKERIKQFLKNQNIALFCKWKKQSSIIKSNLQQKKSALSKTSHYHLFCKYIYDENN